MNLKTTPFSEEEKNKKYQITTFNELGLEINILNEINHNSLKLPSGNNYKFGIIKENKYYWYFNGRAVANNRTKMREIYSGLLEINDLDKTTVFIYKVKKN